MMPGATSSHIRERLRKRRWEDLDLDYLADSRHFHFSSYYLQKRLRPRVGELFQYLKSRGLTVSLDTNDDPDDRWEGGLREILRHVDVFLPNEREACKAAGTEDVEDRDSASFRNSCRWLW